MEDKLVLECEEKNAFVNGVRITYYERGVSFRGIKPTLLFIHATGFHARVWDKIIDKLGPFHSISVDQRGHGRSEKQKIDHWDQVVTDAAELIDQLDLTHIVAIGHSMGGHVLIGAASRCESRFLKVIAIDPVILSEEAYRAGSSPFADSEERQRTTKRRNEFSSHEEMADRLRDKGSYHLFDQDIFMDYCRFGLLPNEKGKGYILACPPEIEASAYTSGRSNHGIYDAIRSLSIPVLILRAQEPATDCKAVDFSTSPTWPHLVDEFKNGREIHFADKTHFLPMQIPDEIAQILKEEIGEWR